MSDVPTPLRFALLLLLRFLPLLCLRGDSDTCFDQGNCKSEEANPDKHDVAAWHVPFAGMALFFVVHWASLRSQHVCADASLTLAEHAVYYSLMQAALLASMEMLAQIQRAAVWHTAAYMGLYYAWHIHRTANAFENCTLSKGLLSASLFLFCFVGVPLCMLYRTDTVLWSRYQIASGHLTGLLVADACAFAHRMLQPLRSQ